MSEDFSLYISMSKEEMNKIKDLLTSTPGLRHFGIELKTGEYLDLVEYKDYEILEKENQQLKNDNAVMEANLIQVSDKQRDLYKEVIEEVREYINREEFIDYIPNTKNYMRLMKIKCDLLQILDKAKGEDNVR